MKTVLMVGYWHPPALGAAAQRFAGFARHLPEFGWQPRLVTAGEPRGDDPPALLRVPDVGPRGVAAFADYVWPEPRRRGLGIPRGWVFPDRFFVWRGRARRAAPASIRRQKSALGNFPSVVWATFPPASAAALGANLARGMRVPLVLDFRDLWFGPGGYDPPTPLHHFLHERMERRLARSASHLVAVSDGMADHLAARYGVPRARVHAIPNGFEPDAASAPSNAEAAADADRGFVLAHVGTVIARNRPDLFFQALAAVGLDRWRRERLRIRFVGNLARDVTLRPEFAGLLETTGMIPADAAGREMRAAGALLLLVGDYVGRWGHNAKLFDYLAAGRPILCLEESPDSNDRRLLESLAAERCVFASLSDPAAIVEAIDGIRAIAAERGAAAFSMPAGMETYSRRTLAGRLARVLDAAAGAGNWLVTGPRGRKR